MLEYDVPYTQTPLMYCVTLTIDRKWERNLTYQRNLLIVFARRSVPVLGEVVEQRALRIHG